MVFFLVCLYGQSEKYLIFKENENVYNRLCRYDGGATAGRNKQHTSDVVLRVVNVHNVTSREK